MTIRPADAQDVPRIVEMGVRFIAESEYWRLGTASVDKLTALALHLMEHGAMFVAEQDGAVVGMVGGFFYEHPMVDATIANEAVWWVEPEARGMVGKALRETFEQWAHERQATHVVMVAPNDRVGRHYEKVGYSTLERAFLRRVG